MQKERGEQVNDASNANVYEKYSIIHMLQKSEFTYKNLNRRLLQTEH